MTNGRGKMRVQIGDQEYVGRVEDFKVVFQGEVVCQTPDGRALRLIYKPIRMVRVLDAEGKPALTDEGLPWCLVQHELTVREEEWANAEP